MHTLLFVLILNLYVGVPSLQGTLAANYDKLDPSDSNDLFWSLNT
jgi:hypothetical protein